MRIAVLGSGYVGLVSGACLAGFGHDVVCVDVDAKRIEALQSGRVPFFEPGLDQLVKDNVAADRLSFTTDVAGAVANAKVVFIAVGTPSRPGDSRADLSFVYAAARSIAMAAKGFTVVVTKSTVPVGTGEELELFIREVNPTANIAVVSNPEFLRQGAAIQDFERPDRVVIGAEGEQAREAMLEVYRPLTTKGTPILTVSRRTAELTKYAANALLAAKITFINEIADLCEKVGADVEDVARGVGLDDRIGPKFLSAGPGFGGSCFPKDTVALLKIGEDHDTALRLVEATVNANELRKRAMGRKVVTACGGSVRGKTVAVLGLTFKPNTDDMREAPSIAIVRALQDRGARIRAFDPEGMGGAKPLLGSVYYAQDAYDAADGADCVVLITEWNAFRTLDLARLREVMRTPRFVDLRNVYDPSEMDEAGFDYRSIGRTTISRHQERQEVLAAE
jgi:UDPglucose 6-dehydrogenase